jgi:hypothetical protein
MDDLVKVGGRMPRPDGQALPAIMPEVAVRFPGY